MFAPSNSPHTSMQACTIHATTDVGLVNTQSEELSWQRLQMGGPQLTTDDARLMCQCRKRRTATCANTAPTTAGIDALKKVSRTARAPPQMFADQLAAPGARRTRRTAEERSCWPEGRLSRCRSVPCNSHTVIHYHEEANVISIPSGRRISSKKHGRKN